MPTDDKKQPDNFNLHIKNKIINYGIFTVLILIALTVGVKYYLVKTNCDRLENYIFVDGRCVFEYKKSEIKNISSTPYITPTPEVNPEQNNSKPTIKFYFTDNSGNRKLFLSATEYEAPTLYKNFLIQSQNDKHVAYDLTTGQETDFYTALSPQYGNELRETIYQIENTIEGKGYSYLMDIYDIDGFTYLTFGGYLASGKILRINQESGVILEVREVSGNPRIHKLNNNYYIFGGDGDGCGGMTVIQRLKETLTQSDTYVIETRCSDGTVLLTIDSIDPETLILGDHETPPEDIMYGSHYSSFSTLDLKTFKKNEFFDFTDYDKNGAVEILNSYYTNGATSLYANSKGEVFIFDGKKIKVTLVKNLKLDTEMDYDQDLIKFKDGYFCIQMNSDQTEFIAFDEQGVINGALNANTFCNIQDDETPQNQNTEINRLKAIAESYDSLPENILIEVN